MSPNKEKLLQEAYDAYYELMLNDFPLEQIGELVAYDVMGYGTTLDERILDVNRLHQLVKDQRDQGAGMEISYTISPVHRRESPAEDTALFVDEVEIRMIVEGEENIIPLRLSSVFEYQLDSWKLVHLHGSKAVETEGDTWHLDEWKQKNEALQKLVDAKTAELSKQYRELEVEAALERVRSRTMAMQNSAELNEVIQVVYDQFVNLNIFIEHTGFIIDYKASDDMNIWLADKNGVPSQVSIPYFDSAHWNSFREAKEKGMDFFVNHLDFDEKNTFYNKLFEYIPGLPDDVKEYYLSCKGLAISTVLLDNVGLYIENFSGLPYSEEENNTLMRFGKVFQQTYTRFLDLQKAEKQAREAQIEAALERTRTQSMLMQHSSELEATSQVFHKQLLMLGIPSEFSYVWLPDEPAGKHLFWASWAENKGKEMTFRSSSITYDLDKSEPYTAACFAAWESENDIYQEYIAPDKVNEFLTTWSELTRGAENLKPELFPEGLYYSEAYMKYGCFGINVRRDLNKDEQDILLRFAVEFERTYTRFLDLKKAEAQAREAQLELSLERIRAQVTAMKESSELLDIVVTMRTEFVTLGHEAHYFWYMRYLPEVYEKAMTSGDGTKIGMVMTLPRHIHGDIKKIAVWEKSDEPTIVFPMNVETAVDYVNKMITLGDFKQVDPNAPTLDDIRHIGGLTFVMARTTHGEIGYSLPGVVPDPPEADMDTLVRFAGVFDLAYRRFEDLKSAERQARENQIELALERVRARTMAMHNSQDVGATVVTLFDEVLKLGLDKDIRCGIGILNKETKYMETWSATSSPDGEVDLKMGLLDMTIHPMLVGLKKAWDRGEKDYTYDYIGDDVLIYYTALNNEPEYPFHVDLDTLPENEYHRSFFYSDGILFSFAPNPISDESAEVLNRFAGVFGQTYRRYLDLQKAEAQAREAQIEAALERVRSKAMAMYSSEDLGLTVDAFFSELKGLGVSPHRCGVGIVDGKTKQVRIQAIDTNPDKKTKKIVGDLTLAGHPVLDKIFESWVNQKEYFPVLRGPEISEYYKVMNPQVAFHEYADDEVQFGYYFYFKEGGVYAWTDKELEEQDIQIFRRYTSVLSLTYRRYLDLKDAESQAKEAIKQASLDRVRGQIASMRSTEDLQRITPLIWRELESLEVPFSRCGVFIIDELNTQVKVYLTTPDGKPLGVLELPFESNDLTSSIVTHWSKKTVYTVHWNKQDFISWMQSMIDLGQIKSRKEYQGNVPPPESLDLHFIPFAQGMLYVGNSEPLPKDKIDLVKSLAKAFSIAYSRYEDFKQLEDAKNKIEITLNDLKSTQSQLIHAEKMASLGELTAGIAHEIQNPLNFVNNFSELNRELLDEMKEEMAGGNNEEVMEIAEDVMQNLEKILHHGKRAEGIVKGMLQHSRTGSSEKAATNINTLADEYLRLAYHGLRAKNKSFNANFITELDENLPEIDVVSQDIGRVMLNLINNAFYAVAEASGKEEGYDPTVKVSTRKLDNGVEIKVKDNGNGIPKDVVEKIFQPFFTTKPTGEGTGLGLSMSYDIITKGHEGELKVNTKEGEGTEFTIVLPGN